MPRRKSTTATKKRQLSSPAAPNIVTSSPPGSRQSKRIKRSTTENTPTTNGAGKFTARRSSFFKAAAVDHDSDEESSSSAEDDDEETSGYEDAPASITSASPSAISSDDQEDDHDSDDSAKGRRKKKSIVAHGGRGRKSNTATPSTNAAAAPGIVENGKELWRQGVKAGLGPGKAVFIEKPKPRGDGGIKYVPETIHPNTMAFLADLDRNNDREWMKTHDADYRTSWKDWEAFVEVLTEKIIEKDDTIPELPPKDLVFRVYRDIRFSRDPTPYKPYFSAAWSRTGRKGPFACYYVQIAPGGKSFVGCGLWMPEAAPLALLRTDIDQRPHRLKCVLMEPGIRKEVLGGMPKDEKKAVKAFLSQNSESALKTKPKGYAADHPNIELLRLKNFTMGTKLKDEEVIGPGCLDKIANLVGTMAPFVKYLNAVVMPDDDDEEEDQEEEEVEEEEELESGDVSSSGTGGPEQE